MKSGRERGFTLIELMVTIGIISILSTVAVANVSKSRELARDARRQQDLSTLAAALEIYANRNGKYPDNLKDLSGGNFPPLTRVPEDPLGGNYLYVPNKDKTTYYVEAKIERKPAGMIELCKDSLISGYCKKGNDVVYRQSSSGT